MPENKQYIGDGVYTSDDGHHIILQTDGNKIYLDDTAIEGLIMYIEKQRNVDITISVKC